MDCSPRNLSHFRSFSIHPGPSRKLSTRTMSGWMVPVIQEICGREEILIEARILAVADVAEAISSHRPYRPGLGINLALAEIEKNEGIYNDVYVADACLKLFREKCFQLAVA